jgi:hypothetical protein
MVQIEIILGALLRKHGCGTMCGNQELINRNSCKEVMCQIPVQNVCKSVQANRGRVTFSPVFCRLTLLRERLIQPRKKLWEKC